MHGLPLSQHKHGMDAMGGGLWACGGVDYTVEGARALELGWRPGGALGVEERS